MLPLKTHYNTLFSLLISLVFMSSLPRISLSMDYYQTHTNLSLGKKIPLIPLINSLTENEREYLGIKRKLLSFSKKKNFYLKEIEADLIILEFFNRYCFSCLAQAPILNRFYQKILQDSTLRDRIKVLAVGVGNNPKEIQQFRQEKKVPFPLIPDPDFEAYESIGDPGGTPFFLILRKTESEELLAESHLGLIADENLFLNKVKDILDLDIASFQIKMQEHLPQEVKKSEPQVSLSDDRIQEKIIACLDPQKKYNPIITKFSLSHSEQIYIIDFNKSDRIFAKVFYRSPVCDLCHPVYFLLLFDKKGVIKDFLPLYITKYGNIPITTEDEQKLKEKIIGRNLTKQHRFQPEFDSVTGATISVSIIFRTLNKARELYLKLQQKGLCN